MKIYKIYVEKKENFNIEAKNLNWDILNLLKLNNVKKTRILNAYYIEGIDENIFKSSIDTIFTEMQTDNFYTELPNCRNMFSVEYLPGQYDKRADFCAQCLKLTFHKVTPIVKTAKIYIFEGELKNNELETIKKYIINPVECVEGKLKIENINTEYKEVRDVELLSNFNSLNNEELKNLILKENLAMSLEDILICQKYFKNEEKRPPTITEIKILDAYWSDHCRHTTFSTIIENVNIKDQEVLDMFNKYKNIKKELNLNNKPITLMDIATIGAKKLKKEGLLTNLDESEEINACSVNIKIPIENNVKDVVLMFKNETHNHPTEIEPFGGAATCLGGAIRDPLSGRCYVYQAMRISGAANPLTPIEKTIKGKLPQRKIVTTSALGYSSYGNQIGIATGFVEEIYNEGYVAKRMEVGAVIGAALKENIIRKTPNPYDVVILIGGKTGRDGCEGATGSSKEHNINSLKNCTTQVQKGNPVEGRKIQRLFKNEKISKIIKKCNDFGAGGVSVAVGELADGVEIYLDRIPKKYEGLSGTELAISESQERMAVVISKENADYFITEAKKENLIAVEIAKITNKNRIVMYWREKKIVDISRKFLNLNGAQRRIGVVVEKQKISPIFKLENTKTNWLKQISRLNIASQKGLVDMFDSTIGANTVLMPYGGKYKKTKIQSMVAKIPINKNENVVSIMSYGLNPYLQQQSPFFGAMYAVVHCLAKIIATGGNLKECWLTFQEYFPAIKNSEKRFALPFLALLGALKAQLELKVAAIGGKDSMSGSFENLDVPPTLISFGVSVSKIENIISPEFKKVGSFVALVAPKYEENNAPNFSSIRNTFSLVENLIYNKKIYSAYAIGFGGVSEAITKMCFGNKIGFEFTEKLDNEILFNASYGSFILELKEVVPNLKIIGKTIESYEIKQEQFKIDINELEKSNEKTLEDIYKTKTNEKFSEYAKNILNNLYNNKYNSKKTVRKTSLLIKTPTPKILIPVFPGTNCELDIKYMFEKHGGKCEIFIITNLNEYNIEESITNFSKKINSANIIAIPGGFSAADEPDGSAKFIASFFRNCKVKEATHKFLKEKDGLMLGICNGFQALIKLGLIEHGVITNPKEVSATLTYNSIGKHKSDIVQTKVISNKSVWLQYENLECQYKIAISHGEGRLIAKDETLQKFIQNDQIASVYVDFNNKISMDSAFNPNGSYLAIEGLTSKDGKIFGRMGHSERMQENLYKNIPNIKYQNIFKAGVDYFKA